MRCLNFGRTSGGRRPVDSLHEMARSLPPELAPGTRLSIEDGEFVLSFGEGRHQVVRARREGDRYVFTSRVLGKRRVDHMSYRDLAHLIWRRNRRTPLVSFLLDPAGRLVGRIEQPIQTLDPPELAAYLLLLARECDRLEFLLTGRDEQ